MVKPSINKKRYFIALVLTSLVFLLGLLVGYGVTGLRLNKVQEGERDLRFSYDSAQLQTLYISSLLREQNCPQLKTVLDTNINSIQRTADNLENYIKSTQFRSGDFDSLKREYILAQLRYWLLAQQFKEICDQDVVLILYFFSSSVAEPCNDCGPQGTILSYLKNIFQDKLLVFSMDKDFDQEPLIPILLNDYAITSAPSIVIDSEPYYGLQTKEQLLKSICGKFKSNVDGCS